MVVSMSEQEYRRELEPAFTSIFQSIDPFGEPFRDRIAHRLLLWPVGFALDDAELAAVMDAVRAEGETSFCVSFLERPDEDESPKSDADARPWHWHIPLEQANEYRALTLPFENALYSPSGKWGIMISHEQHAAVGGDQRFLQTLLNHRAIAAKSSPGRFLEYWQDAHTNWGAEVKWVPRLLDHIYGQDQAHRLMVEYGFHNYP